MAAVSQSAFSNPEIPVFQHTLPSIKPLTPAARRLHSSLNLPALLHAMQHRNVTTTIPTTGATPKSIRFLLSMQILCYRHPENAHKASREGAYYRRKDRLLHRIPGFRRFLFELPKAVIL